MSNQIDSAGGEHWTLLMDGRDGEMQRRMGTVDTSPLTSMGWLEVQVRGSEAWRLCLTADSFFTLTCTLAHS